MITRDLERKRGDTAAYKIRVLEEDTGAAVDVTGSTFAFTVDPAKSPSTGDNNIISIAGTITTAAQGEVEFRFTTSDADNTGTYFYDIQMTDANTRITTLQEGKLKFTQDITK